MMNNFFTWNFGRTLLVQCVPGGHDCHEYYCCLLKNIFTCVGGPGEHEHHHVDDGHLERLHQTLLLVLVVPVLVKVERLVRQQVGGASESDKQINNMKSKRKYNPPPTLISPGRSCCNSQQWQQQGQRKPKKYFFSEVLYVRYTEKCKICLYHLTVEESVVEVSSLDRGHGDWSREDWDSLIT